MIKALDNKNILISLKKWGGEGIAIYVCGYFFFIPGQYYLFYELGGLFVWVLGLVFNFTLLVVGLKFSFCGWWAFINCG